MVNGHPLSSALAGARLFIGWGARARLPQNKFHILIGFLGMKVQNRNGLWVNQWMIENEWKSSKKTLKIEWMQERLRVAGPTTEHEWKVWMRFACGGKISILTDWSAAARLSHQILTNFLTLCSHKYTNTNTRQQKHKYTTKLIHNHTDTNTQNYTNKIWSGP